MELNKDQLKDSGDQQRGSQNDSVSLEMINLKASTSWLQLMINMSK